MRTPLFLACLTVASPLFAQAPGFDGLSDAAPSSTVTIPSLADPENFPALQGLDLSLPLDYSLPAGTEAGAKSAECASYLRLNAQLNPDRYRDYCAVQNLSRRDLERIRAGIRAQRRGCAEVARLQVEDYRFRNQWEEASGQNFGGDSGGPSADYSIQWTLQLGTGRQRVRLRTPIGSARKTLVDGRSLSSGSSHPHRSERHHLVERAGDIRDDLRDEARDFNLPGVRDQFSRENLGTYAVYEGMRKLERSASRGSNTWERRAQGAFREQGDCERYWDSRDREVLAELGRRR